MSLMDALFYWLQMKWIVSERPEDDAAKDTLAFFAQILSEDHRLTSFDVSSIDEGKVYITYTGGADNVSSRTVWFDRESVEQLNRDMFGGASSCGADSNLEDDEED
ncbi:hypothetical protein J4772_17820 [Cohnella sp. LGH]|uniref:hypothetical protein n=1 Tax=Cohnella sp. LGH TaxID=1619153 RepID=UPI001ADD33A7|nr:hypothetical protein J4772_17820 [Cohnella sp. LGH]